MKALTLWIGRGRTMKSGIDLLLAVAEHDDRVLLLLQSASAGDNFMQAAGLDRASRTRARNAALSEAADILSADGCGPWETARRLSDAVGRFSAFVMPRLSPGRYIELSPVDYCIKRAFLTGVHIPTSDGYLYELIK